MSTEGAFSDLLNSYSIIEEKYERMKKLHENQRKTIQSLKQSLKTQEANYKQGVREGDKAYISMARQRDAQAVIITDISGVRERQELLIIELEEYIKSMEDPK